MPRMPVLFVGHGSPTNAIEDNDYTQAWERVAREIPRPRAIVSLSAHWFTRGTRIMNQGHPETIHDMYGFPQALYDLTYDAPGDPELAQEVAGLISRKTTFDQSWGLDHGTWSVLAHLYPERDIPVIQVSIDATATPEEHYRTGRELAPLRDRGVLLLGSGNVVHNLRMVDWSQERGGYDWAREFDDHVKGAIERGGFEDVVGYRSLGQTARLAVPTPDHFSPLLYVLGGGDPVEKAEVFNHSCTLGSLSMTSFLLG